MEYKDIDFSKHELILFDGECIFCNKTIQFIIENDKKEYFLFAALQSNIGRKIKSKYFTDKPIPDSILLDTGKKVELKSSAILKIFRRCRRVWIAYYFFYWIPSRIRDFFYDKFAEKRYAIFGKSTTCMLPEPAIRERFFI